MNALVKGLIVAGIGGFTVGIVLTINDVPKNLLNYLLYNIGILITAVGGWLVGRGNE